MGNIIVIIIVAVILGVASYKLYINRKNNVKCSGCTSCNLNETCNDSKIKDS